MPQQNVTGVLILCPASNQMMTVQTAQTLFWLAQWLTASGIPSQFIWLSVAGIVDARTLLLTKWYDNHPEFSHLLFIDADMHFSPALIADMLAFGKPLTGAFYCRREIPLGIIGRVLDDDNKVVDGFMKVKEVGGGVLLIARAVVERMLDKLPEINDSKRVGRLQSAAGISRMIRAFDECDGDNGEHLSEDYAFCHRWRQCGGEVWANVEHAIAHIGPFTYAVRYADCLEAGKPAPASPAPLWSEVKAAQSAGGKRTISGWSEAAE